MTYEIFSILDNAVKAYNTPMFFRTRLEAIRSFSDAVNQENSQFRKHAHDYHLVYLGQYDDGDGNFSPVVPERVVGALDCLRAEENAAGVAVQKLSS